MITGALAARFHLSRELERNNIAKHKSIQEERDDS